jgi:hypothetical protein
MTAVLARIAHETLLLGMPSVQFVVMANAPSVLRVPMASVPIVRLVLMASGLSVRRVRIMTLIARLVIQKRRVLSATVHLGRVLVTANLVKTVAARVW